MASEAELDPINIVTIPVDVTLTAGTNRDNLDALSGQRSAGIELVVSVKDEWLPLIPNSAATVDLSGENDEVGEHLRAFYEQDPMQVLVDNFSGSSFINSDQTEAARKSLKDSITGRTKRLASQQATFGGMTGVGFTTTLWGLVENNGYASGGGFVTTLVGAIGLVMVSQNGQEVSRGQLNSISSLEVTTARDAVLGFLFRAAKKSRPVAEADMQSSEPQPSASQE